MEETILGNMEVDMNSIPLQHVPEDPFTFRRPTPEVEEMLLNSDEPSKAPMGFIGTCDTMMSDFESLYDDIESNASTVDPIQ
jgi:hypothetical protein